MKKWLKRALIFFGTVFVLANVMAFLHARKFTHFDPEATERLDEHGLSSGKKLQLLFSGVSLPRPRDTKLPYRPFTELVLQRNKRIACWSMRVPGAKGSVVLCHGYGGSRKDMLQRAYFFMDEGYNVLLPDFMGAGASEGNECTIGYKEADNVKACIEYLVKQGERNIYLMGASMGAAAIMRACSLEPLPVKGLILECPFGSLRQTVKNRFETVGVPAFPLADMLVFWGGLQHGFNGFSHNPEDYARKIHTPVLLLYGARDDRVRRFEIDRIFAGLAGPRTLVVFPLSGHESYQVRYPQQWMDAARSFLAAH